MRIEACNLPPSSQLDRRLVASAWFRDSYRAPIARHDADAVRLFLAIFGHRPGWMKAIMLVRNQLAAWCGLRTASPRETMSPEIRAEYQVGDEILAWPIFGLSPTELIAGRDNRHLDFRVSVLKDEQDGRAWVTVSTVCDVHNRFGKAYLAVIAPFHRWGVQRLIANAVAAGRL
jgi:hypothetical protein